MEGREEGRVVQTRNDKVMWCRDEILRFSMLEAMKASCPIVKVSQGFVQNEIISVLKCSSYRIYECRNVN